MTDSSSGQVVPAPELMEVALATCVLAFAHARGVGLFVDRNWRLLEFTPLRVAFLATASTVAAWQTEGEPAQSALTSELHRAFQVVRPGESFERVANRLLLQLEQGQSTVFTVRHTLGGNVKYYEMMDDEYARRLVRETAKVHGENVILFCEAVERAFTSMRVFLSQTEEAHYQWQQRQRSGD